MWAAAEVRLIVRCKACGHQVEPDPVEMATRYGAETSVLDWREKLVFFKCGSRGAPGRNTGGHAIRALTREAVASPADHLPEAKADLSTHSLLARVNGFV